MLLINICYCIPFAGTVIPEVANSRPWDKASLVANGRPWDKSSLVANGRPWGKSSLATAQSEYSSLFRDQLRSTTFRDQLQFTFWNL